MERDILYGFEATDWYCNKYNLKRNTPSIRYGMSYNTERKYRARGIKFIKDLAEILELGYNAVATASLFFHRFYLHRAFQHFPEYRTAASCLYLAGKVEETPKLSNVMLRHIVKILSDEVYHYNYGENSKKEFYIMERVLLYTLKMDFVVEHPYNYILRYTKHFKDRTGDASRLGKVVQLAWAFMNDSLYITLCIQYEPQILAIAALYLAAKFNRYKVVDWENKMPDHNVWWDSFVDDYLPIRTIQGISDQIMNAYKQIRDLEREAFYLEILEPDIFNAPPSLRAIRLIPDSLTPNSYNLVLSSSDCPMLTDSSTDATDELYQNNQSRCNVDPSIDHAPLHINPTSQGEQDQGITKCAPVLLSIDHAPLHINPTYQVEQDQGIAKSGCSSDYRLISSPSNRAPSSVLANIANGTYIVGRAPTEHGYFGYGGWNEPDGGYDADNERDIRLPVDNLIPQSQYRVPHNVQIWFDKNYRWDSSVLSGFSDRQRENTLPSVGQGSKNVPGPKGQKNRRRNRKRNRKPNRKQNRRQKRKNSRKRRLRKCLS